MTVSLSFDARATTRRYHWVVNGEDAHFMELSPLFDTNGLPVDQGGDYTDEVVDWLCTECGQAWDAVTGETWP